MIDREQYIPGPASGAQVIKEGENWTLVLVRDLRHSPEKVWRALTDPAELSQWAPYDADRNLGAVGPVKLTTVAAPSPIVSETIVTRSEAPRLLEFKWGENDTRWELEESAAGTRLTLWTKLNRRYIAMGAAGWHICLDILDRHIAGTPVGRTVGPVALNFDGWKRLHKEYAAQFGIDTSIQGIQPKRQSK